MAKFRSNHTSNQYRNSTLRFILFIPLAAFLLVAGYNWVKNLDTNFEPEEEFARIADSLRYYIPISRQDYQIIHHKLFSLGYAEKHEQPAWVAYTLSRDQLNMKKHPRPDNFRPDYQVLTRSSFSRDFAGTGYTRGHLVPAADMSYDSVALEETFFMSNISPQTRSFNNGIWRELEEGTRDWARKYRKLFIVSGPILTDLVGTIGQNKVAIPSAFYKVILDLEKPEYKGIGFIIPNQLNEKPLESFACSIDRVEEVTNLDFFSNLLDKKLETEIEGAVDIQSWPINKERYQRRISEWNFR